jgi:hypothetical protein
MSATTGTGLPLPASLNQSMANAFFGELAPACSGRFCTVP